MAKVITLADSKALNDVKEQIARRAYELYEARGREDGYDLQDWLCAEAEIVGHTAKAAGA